MRLFRALASRRNDDVRSDAPNNGARAAALASEHASILEAVDTLTRGGRLGDALALIDEALSKEPNDCDVLFARASILFSWWRYAEAYALLIRIERSGLRSGAFYAKLGWTCFWLGRVDDAAAWMRKAVAREPDDWSTHFGLAIALRAQKHSAASKAEFERVLALKPDDPHAISNLVACDVELGHVDTAERNARRALERDPQNSSAMIDLGIVLCEQAHYADAIAAFEHADTVGFSSADARDESVNYAICLLRAGRVQQAITMMETKLNRYPSAALHSHYALALLASGRMREGWDQYEFRWLQEPLLSWRPKFVKPVWAGQDLRGKTILLRAEQGYGDFIQFIRYASHIKALGAMVLLEVRDDLRELATRTSGVDRILRNGEPYPDFDYYINLLSIPRILGTDLDSIPAEVPYLRADPERAAHFEDKISRDGLLNVGLVWAGSPTHLGDRFRSLPLRALAPLRAIKGVRFHSLQKGPAASELVTDRGHDPIVDLGPELATFADTAAAIDQLDLIIGVDTSVVHAAGALGKPVWTLVAIPCDWRWLESREDSPWYPTMRLFRQREPGAWDEVISRLKSALEEQVERHVERRETDARVPVSSSPNAEEPAVPFAWSVATNLCRVAETRAGIMMYVPDDTVAGRSIEFYGEYAHLQFESLARMLEPGMTALEVGAGIGVHSVPLASALGSEGHLFLYEDNAFLKHVLNENLRGNKISNATLMRRSLTRMACDDQHEAGTRPLTWGVPESDAAEPQRETIDELRLESLHWLKINESTEAAIVIQGAQATLGRLRPRLFIAVPDEEALLRIADTVKGYGYVCWRMEAPMFNRANFNGRDVDVFSGRKSVTLLGVPKESESQTAIEGCERML